MGAASIPQRHGAADVLIVGAGLAGLFLALKLAPRRCLVLSPAPLGEAASSAWAQGGLAVALSPQDSPAAHARDTVAAGAGLVDPAIARLIAEEGPRRVRDLIALGVPFDRTPDGQLMQSLEAAHTWPRVARVAGDLAGKAIMGALVGATRAAEHIEVATGLRAVGLIENESGIGGAVCADGEGRLLAIHAGETVLATGGVGGLYRVTTNPVSALGDSLAMAHMAGALIADPEFVQFHPTAIDIDRDPAPLATEALRGEGAVLVDAAGMPFMHRYHELGDLAPRDVVARAIHTEREAANGAFLDCRAAIGAGFPEHFPTVFAACQSAGIDPRTALIPVAPAAHYHMGGIAVDTWGRSSLQGLSACGECSCTGAHGANRLASNSLLEAVVFAERIARRLTEDAPTGQPGGTPRPLADADARTLPALRQLMEEHVGVVRSAEGLSTALDGLDSFAHRQPPQVRPLVAARLIAEAALAREESRGGHYRSDFPDPLDPARTYVHADARQLTVRAVT